MLLAASAAALWLLKDGMPSKARGLWLVQRPTGDIIRVDITDPSDKRELRLESTEGEWFLDGEESVTRDRVAPMLAALSYLKASRKVDTEDASDLAQYGLSEPREILSVSYSDGGRDEWRIGADVAGQGAYIMGEDGGTYLIDELRANVIGTLMETFLESPLKQVDFGRINGILIRSRSNGEILLNRSESPRSGGDFFWRIFKPYHCNAKKSGVEDIIAAVANEGWVRRAEDKDLADIETGDALALYDAYDRQLVLDIGDSSGGRAYCKVGGLSGAYTIGDGVMTIFDVTPESLIDMTLYHYEPSSVMEFQFVWEGREHYFISVWEDSGVDGHRGQRFIMDGNTVAGADYREFTAALGSVSGEGLYSGEERGLGMVVGSMYAKRLSPPYEQTIKFREIHGDPGYVCVDYDGDALIRVRKERLGELADIADAMAAREYGKRRNL
jgi:hypothetical protein